MKNFFLACLIVGFIFMISFLLPASAWAQSRQFYVFAAASLTEAMKEIADRFEQQYGSNVHLNLAGSNTLRIQIEKGLPCDIFISADPFNVDKLIARNLVVPFEKRPLLSNQLVVITHLAGQKELKHLEELVQRLTDFLSLADPQTVPAGIYAKEALSYAGIWPLIKRKVVPSMDVRAAVVQVERGNADYGIVYKTDAAVSPQTHIIYEVPEIMHPPIQYVVCLVKNSENNDIAREFFMYLGTEDIKHIFAKYGFTVL